MGVLVVLMNFISNVWVAVPFLILLGGLGGFLVVPMNALLQHRGHKRIVRTAQNQGLNANFTQGTAITSHQTEHLFIESRSVLDDRSEIRSCHFRHRQGSPQLVQGPPVGTTGHGRRRRQHPDPATPAD